MKCFSDLICLQNTPCGSSLQILNIGCIFYQTLLFEIFSLKSGNNFPKLMLLIWHTLYPELVMSSLSYLLGVQSHSDFFFFFLKMINNVLVVVSLLNVGSPLHRHKKYINQCQQTDYVFNYLLSFLSLLFLFRYLYQYKQSQSMRSVSLWWVSP